MKKTMKKMVVVVACSAAVSVAMPSLASAGWLPLSFVMPVNGGGSWRKSGEQIEDEILGTKTSPMLADVKLPGTLREMLPKTPVATDVKLKVKPPDMVPGKTSSRGTARKVNRFTLTPIDSSGAIPRVTDSGTTPIRIKQRRKLRLGPYAIPKDMSRHMNLVGIDSATPISPRTSSRNTNPRRSSPRLDAEAVPSVSLARMVHSADQKSIGNMPPLQHGRQVRNEKKCKVVTGSTQPPPMAPDADKPPMSQTMFLNKLRFWQAYKGGNRAR